MLFNVTNFLNNSMLIYDSQSFVAALSLPWKLLKLLHPYRSYYSLSWCLYDINRFHRMITKIIPHSGCPRAVCIFNMSINTRGHIQCIIIVIYIVFLIIILVPKDSSGISQIEKLHLWIKKNSKQFTLGA